MRIALIDYKDPVVGFANRDQTGGFGSGMHAHGMVGKLVTKLKKTGLRLPVLNLGYLCAIGRAAGHEVNFYTGMPDGEDIIVLASSMHHYRYERDFAREIKQRFPRAKIGFIGPFSSEFPERFEAVSDFIILGEPEEIFEQICRGNIEAVGRIVAPGKVDVNRLPFPDWKGFDLDSYGYAPILPRKPFLTIQASRGCPFACEFCPYLVQQGVPLRRRDNDRIVAEMEYLVREYGIKSLLFRDITWSMNKKLSKELCKRIADKQFDLDIGVETRADTLDEELILLMSKANIKVVNLGIESPENDILSDSGRKPIKKDKLEETIRLLEKNGIQVQAFYIIGLIDDDEDSVKKTIRYSHQLNTFTAQFCVLTPFPGTKTYGDLKDRITTTDFARFTEYEPVVGIDGLSAEKIRHYLNRAFNSYYMRTMWLYKHGFNAFLSVVRQMARIR